jgi:SAM-dependent methyltransferase
MRNGMIVNEHFVPKLGLDLEPYLAKGDRTAVHHLARYRWAIKIIADMAPPKQILDGACGSGYGSYLLARAFPQAQIIGADYDKSAIDYARKQYSSTNLRFIHGDVLWWEQTIGQTTFDCIVSFDTLEHCKHREIMLENLVEHLHPEGRLLLSAPSGWATNNLSPRWHHHAIEYSPASLYDFLSRYFRSIRRPEEPDFPHRAVFEHMQQAGIDYSLCLNPVICSQPIQVVNPYKALDTKHIEPVRL